MGISIETLALARKYANTISKDRSVNQEFLDGFVVNGTTEELCKSIEQNEHVRTGHSFMGGVALTDMPFQGNAECKIDVIKNTYGNTIIALELISANIAPYRWYGLYWHDFEGWAPLITEDYLRENFSSLITEEVVMNDKGEVEIVEVSPTLSVNFDTMKLEADNDAFYMDSNGYLNVKG